MDEQTLKTMPVYVQNLPQAVQDFVFDGVWEKRITEVAKKYSLNEIQTDTLINNTLFVLIGLDTPDTFTNLMTSELGISKLLAEQIVEDLETRVFEYALSQIQNKEKPETPIADIKSSPINVGEKFGPVTTQPNNIFADIKTQIKKMDDTAPRAIYMPKIEVGSKNIEVRPETLPMVEKGEVAHDVAKQTISVPKYDATPSVKPAEEPIQRPVPVPRFTATPIVGEAKPVVAPVPVAPTPPEPVAPAKPKEPSIIDSKLNTVVKSIEEKPKAETPVKAYVVDPYREPLG